jgi:hypothetical protein
MMYPNETTILPPAPSRGFVRLQRKIAAFAIAAIVALSGCPAAEPEPKPVPTRHYTWRAITGVSMGGGAAASLGFKKPELWDFIGIMGGPVVDMTGFQRMLQRNWLGGFCSLEALEALLANGHSLDDETAFCGLYTDQPDANLAPELMATPQWAHTQGQEPVWEAVSDYNNWWRGPDGGRGGSFRRDSLFRSFEDILKAMGNPLYPLNEELPWAAPGVTKEWLALSDEERCANPITVAQEYSYNAEYNPLGAYPVITYCEGRHHDPEGSQEAMLGRILPDTPRTDSIAILLAVDLNRNGRRDYAEPVMVNPRERFADTGLDGLRSVDEPGYDPITNPDPAGDDWNPFDNVHGLENNWHYDAGETYHDFGLDGVAETGDFGEGNGTYDYSPGWNRVLTSDPGHLFKQLAPEQLDRLTVYMDAGIRDFLNTAITSNRLWSEIKSKVGAEQTQVFHNFPELAIGDELFNPNDIASERLAQFSYMRYGTIGASENQILRGDGNHVGTAQQVVSRIQLIMSVAQGFWPRPNLDRRWNPVGDAAYVGQGTFVSPVTGFEREYSFALPPGYHDPENAQEDYPVLYFLHGQGMKHRDMVGTAIVFLTAMAESQRSGRSDWSKFIIIFPDGECPETDACHSGNFWSDFASGEAETQYATDFYELVKHVDTTYRVRPGTDVPLSEVPNALAP